MIDTEGFNNTAARLGLSITIINLKAEKHKLQEALRNIETELRKAGTMKLELYHNARDKELQEQFIKMADYASGVLEGITQ